ncbi:hypothetical protein [Kitasatospora sp. NPDC057198]|uniref:hypothetical protein n=1 Tax=Kitasatospora sp. NPDC057198 TaxID=3346046 RepID=UPI0036424F10
MAGRTAGRMAGRTAGRIAGWGAGAALVVLAASGCGPLVGDDMAVKGTCQGSGKRLDVLRGLAVGTSAPAGATPVNWEYSISHTSKELEAECVGDSTTPWLRVGRLYRHPGPAAEVLGFYRDAAAADGWRLDTDAADDDPDGYLCFSRKVDGRPTLLVVTLRPERAPGPDVYQVTVKHSTYDPETHCG